MAKQLLKEYGTLYQMTSEAEKIALESVLSKYFVFVYGYWLALKFKICAV